MTNKAREALLAVVDCAFDGRLKITETAFEKVLEALKEPVRNCDLYADYGDALRAFENDEDAESYEDIGEWLFDKAKTKQEVQVKEK